MSFDDTIIALSSGVGRAGIAVFRLTGAGCSSVVRQLTGKPAPRPRLATVRWLYDGTGSAFDQALVVYFEGPSSFTGEDMVEFHVHGGHAIQQILLDTVLSLPGVRLAGPGDFTRRAFENGKLDLAEAEGVADLINADTPRQLKQALFQVEGEFSNLHESLRRKLIDASAILAAGIDFPDEGDVPVSVVQPALRMISDALEQVSDWLKVSDQGLRLRDGVSIAIVGPPNAGKSTLLNALAEQDAAIVTDIAGTTRDVVEVRCIMSGVPVYLADTAGLRESDDLVEKEGMRRARLKAESADLRLGVYDINDPPADDVFELLRRGDVLIANKLDTVSTNDQAPLEFPGIRTVAMSAHSTKDLENLRGLVRDAVEELVSGSETPAVTRLRHRHALEEGRSALERARSVLEGSDSDQLELASEDVHLAVRRLGAITGRVDVEEVLGAVFADFCIGK